MIVSLIRVIIIIKMSESTGKTCGCENQTFIKFLNLAVGVAMVIFGIFNIFGFLKAKS